LAAGVAVFGVSVEPAEVIPISHLKSHGNMPLPEQPRLKLFGEKTVGGRAGATAL
jgi:hypothetical protein